MDVLLYPLALLVTLGVLVTVHEYGHFILARRSGVRVVRFSVGFGRPLVRWQDRQGTEFVIAALPLGGYVRMLDEREPGEIPVERGPNDVSFLALSPLWRMAIAAGGPLANLLLAAVVYWLLAVLGTTTLVPVLGPVADASPLGRAAASSGLTGAGLAGQEIVSVDGAPTRSWQEVAMALAPRLGDSGAIALGLAEPGTSAVRTVAVPIQAWHRGEDEPDLFASLGIEPTLMPIVGDVVPDGAAAAAGLQRLDRVLAVDGDPVRDWRDWVDRVQAAPGQTLQVTILRDGVERVLSVTPAVRAADPEAADQPQTGDGAQSQPQMQANEIGFVGVGPYLREIDYGLLAAVPRAGAETWDKTVLTLKLLGKMVTGDVSMKNLSGPITIARVAGDSARSGVVYFLGILALLSISLAVLNLLPIPILDGGNILFCAIEALRGKPLPERVQAVGMQIGLYIVGGLMIIALYNDFARLLS
ncbi:MAG: RIP metalloprotease RseP [Gammaproteobacteria bacterium]